MKISILLPYKENYSENYAGAVSIFINGVNNFSKFKKQLKYLETHLMIKYFHLIILIFL